MFWSGPDLGVLLRSGGFTGIRLFWSGPDPDILVVPDVLVRSGSVFENGRLIQRFKIPLKLKIKTLGEFYEGRSSSKSGCFSRILIRPFLDVGSGSNVFPRAGSVDVFFLDGRIRILDPDGQGRRSTDVWEPKLQYIDFFYIICLIL